jgi:hypothetical protein
MNTATAQPAPPENAMTYSTLALLKIAASATFRPMTSSDRMGFDCPADTLIADRHPEVLVLHAPKTALDEERLEFHGVDSVTGEPFCTVIEVTQAL